MCQIYFCIPEIFIFVYHKFLKQTFKTRFLVQNNLIEYRGYFIVKKLVYNNYYIYIVKSMCHRNYHYFTK